MKLGVGGGGDVDVVCVCITRNPGKCTCDGTDRFSYLLHTCTAL